MANLWFQGCQVVDQNHEQQQQQGCVGAQGDGLRAEPAEDRAQTGAYEPPADNERDREGGQVGKGGIHREMSRRADEEHPDTDAQQECQQIVESTLSRKEQPTKQKRGTQKE